MLMGCPSQFEHPIALWREMPTRRRVASWDCHRFVTKSARAPFWTSRRQYRVFLGRRPRPFWAAFQVPAQPWSYGLFSGGLGMQILIGGGRLRALAFVTAMVSAMAIGALVSGSHGVPSVPALEAQLSLALLISAAGF